MAAYPFLHTHDLYVGWSGRKSAQSNTYSAISSTNLECHKIRHSCISKAMMSKTTSADTLCLRKVLWHNISRQWCHMDATCCSRKYVMQCSILIECVPHSLCTSPVWVLPVSHSCAFIESSFYHCFETWKQNICQMQNETPCQLLNLSSNISKTFMLIPHPKIRV